jgi:hypothetical protein
MGYFFTIKCIRIGIINQQSEAIKGTKKELTYVIIAEDIYKLKQNLN